MGNKIFTTAEAAAYVGLKPQTLANKRCKGGNGPKYLKYGSRAVRYRESDLKDYMDAHLITPVG